MAEIVPSSHTSTLDNFLRNTIEEQMRGKTPAPTDIPTTYPWCGCSLTECSTVVELGEHPMSFLTGIVRRIDCNITRNTWCQGQGAPMQVAS